jgi:hypothetical protein
LGALWLTPQTIALAPGSAHENLLSASLRGCYSLTQARTFRLDGCSGAFVGRAHAEASGFAQNMRKNELYLALPLELALTLHTGKVSWELGAAALIPCPPNEFRIEGQGALYQPPKVAGLFTLRVVLEPWR